MFKEMRCGYIYEYRAIQCLARHHLKAGIDVLYYCGDNGFLRSHSGPHERYFKI